MSKLFPVFLFAITVACGQTSGGATSDASDSRTQMKLEQYKVQGMALYKKHCSQCHQASGEGLASLYPPLKQSDYLMEDLARAACIIKNGQVETIVVNGKTYNQMMPGLSLTPLEIAEIITYITNAWGNEAGLSDVKTVEKWLEGCE